MAATIQYFVDSSGQVWAITVQTDGSFQSTPVGSIPPPTTGFYTTTAGAVIASAVGDAQVATTNRVQLLDYVDRVQKRILRESQWAFLRSQPQRFITEPGSTDYWIANTTPPATATNTGLSLSDVWSIDPYSVWDRSNYRQLKPNANSVNYSSPDLSTPDAQPRYDTPRSFKYTMTNPGVLSIFPAPSAANEYQPVPLPPVATYASGGSLAARTYYVYATFVDSEGGESTPSTMPITIYVPANSLLSVQVPKAVIASADTAAYGSWNVYVGTTATNATKQNSSPLTAAYTEPSGGITTTGPTPPATSTIQPLYGYIIEFIYYQQRQTVTTQNQVLQIPDIYRDVVVAGVNWLTDLYINKDPELTKAMAWKQEFLDGLRQIRKDMNANFRSTNFIAPDGATQTSYTNGLDQFGPMIGEI